MKPGTFTQLYIHLIFAVQYRQYLLHETIKSKVCEYMSGIITNMGHKSIAINGMPDHVHILFGLKPDISISDTVHGVKRNTSLFINQQQWFRGNFAWQTGYGAFSYSRSQLDDVYQYILNQEEHHKKRTFKEEYIDFLKKFEIEFEPRFLFDFWDGGVFPAE